MVRWGRESLIDRSMDRISGWVEEVQACSESRKWEDDGGQRILKWGWWVPERRKIGRGAEAALSGLRPDGRQAASVGDLGT